MARITVEDCIDMVSDRFDLVMKAAHRSRAISRGEKVLVSRDKDKSTVLALREIADGCLDLAEMEEEMIKAQQVVRLHDDKSEDEFVDLIDTHTRRPSKDDEPVDPFLQVAKKDKFIVATEEQPGLSKFEDVDVEELEE